MQAFSATKHRRRQSSIFSGSILHYHRFPRSGSTSTNLITFYSSSLTNSLRSPGHDCGSIAHIKKISSLHSLSFPNSTALSRSSGMHPLTGLAELRSAGNCPLPTRSSCASFQYTYSTIKMSIGACVRAFLLKLRLELSPNISSFIALSYTPRNAQVASPSEGPLSKHLRHVAEIHHCRHDRSSET